MRGKEFGTVAHLASGGGAPWALHKRANGWAKVTTFLDSCVSGGTSGALRPTGATAANK